MAETEKELDSYSNAPVTKPKTTFQIVLLDQCRALHVTYLQNVVLNAYEIGP